jgi:uncharacterized membrane protein YkgB
MGVKAPIYNMKHYLLSRAASLSAWIGAIIFIAEILLHLGHVSTLMLVLGTVLVVVPEDKVRGVFARWTVKLNEYLKD